MLSLCILVVRLLTFREGVSEMLEVEFGLSHFPVIACVTQISWRGFDVLSWM
jgi:hypothetical protein